MDIQSKGAKLYRHARTIIPGGTQLLSKRPEMFLPDIWPAYYKTAKGCIVTDLDDQQYADFTIMGVGTCLLGYNDEDVTEAVVNAVRNGNMTTLNAPEEVELAELLIELHPWAEMVRYARCGGEAMAIAVRLARAASGKDIVLFCGYHGWLDWYLAANIADDAALDGHLLSGLNPVGVSRGLSKTAIPFAFNDVEAFQALVNRYSGRIGAIVMESVRNEMPSTAFLNAVHNAKAAEQVPLVVDEVTAGFRLVIGGAHLVVGWKPDIAVFAKAISNGHPMAAIIGVKSVMDMAQESFISSSYWTDRTGPVAALATIKKLKAVDAPKVLADVGQRIQNGWTELFATYNVKAKAGGILPLSHIDGLQDTLLWKTVFTQEMLAEGFLATTAVYATIAHTPEMIEKYLEACDRVLKRMGQADDINTLLQGPIAHNGFQRLT